MLFGSACRYMEEVMGADDGNTVLKWFSKSILTNFRHRHTLGFLMAFWDHWVYH